MNRRGSVFCAFDSWAIWNPPGLWIEAEIWIRRRTLSSYGSTGRSREARFRFYHYETTLSYYRIATLSEAARQFIQERR